MLKYMSMISFFKLVSLKGIGLYALAVASATQPCQENERDADCPKSVSLSYGSRVTIIFPTTEEERSIKPAHSNQETREVDYKEWESEFILGCRGIVGVIVGQGNDCDGELLEQWWVRFPHHLGSVSFPTFALQVEESPVDSVGDGVAEVDGASVTEALLCKCGEKMTFIGCPADGEEIQPGGYTWFCEGSCGNKTAQVSERPHFLCERCSDCLCCACGHLARAEVCQQMFRSSLLSVKHAAATFHAEIIKVVLFAGFVLFYKLIETVSSYIFSKLLPPEFFCVRLIARLQLAVFMFKCYFDAYDRYIAAIEARSIKKKNKQTDIINNDKIVNSKPSISSVSSKNKKLTTSEVGVTASSPLRTTFASVESFYFVAFVLGIVFAQPIVACILTLLGVLPRDGQGIYDVTKSTSIRVDGSNESSIAQSVFDADMFDVSQELTVWMFYRPASVSCFLAVLVAMIRARNQIHSFVVHARSVFVFAYKDQLKVYRQQQSREVHVVPMKNLQQSSGDADAKNCSPRRNNKKKKAHKKCNSTA